MCAQWTAFPVNNGGAFQKKKETTTIEAISAKLQVYVCISIDSCTTGKQACIFFRHASTTPVIAFIPQSSRDAVHLKRTDE